MAEKNKVVKMKINVDLECPKCYKKIKKVLCGFHEIRDQVYDEKADTVTITAVCCSPENIKQKIWCKAGNTVLAIQTIPDNPKQPERPNTKLVPAPAPAPKPPQQPICVYPGYPAPGVWGCQGYGGGAPYYARLQPPPMCSDRCGRPAYGCSDGCGRPAYACQVAYSSDENPSGCIVM